MRKGLIRAGVPLASAAAFYAALVFAGSVTAQAANGGESQNSAAASPEVCGAVGELRLHELQYIGTHNSYHIAPDGALVVLARLTDYAESADWPAERLYLALDYTHPSLTTQLELGMRQFEIDVHHDPVGGRFAQPGALRALQISDIPSSVTYDPLGRMAQPGFKVFHGGTDVMSTCLTLRDCLGELKDWSEANPRHFPIVLQIEAKWGEKPPLADAYTPPEEPPFDAAAWSELEEELVEILGRDAIVTPSEVQGESRSLAHALRENGWPQLNQLAGRFVVLLLNKGEETNSYLRASDEMPYNLFFTSRALTDPDGGWFRIPDPEYPDLHRVVRRNQLVTVQADTHTLEGRLNRIDRREQAFESGAHFILTDFPIPDRRFSEYQVRFGPNRYVRCNPQTFQGICPF